MNIALSLIQDSPRPVRTSWDEDKLNELAQSIAEQGVIVPVKVRVAKDVYENCEKVKEYKSPSCWELEQAAIEEYGPITDGYPRCAWCDNRLFGLEDESAMGPYFELVYGHRRVEAARRAGLTEMPAVVEGVDDDAAQWQALTENVQREDMTAMDIVTAIQDRIEHGASKQDVAQRLGWSSGRVRNILALAHAPDVVSRAMHAGAHLTSEHFAATGALANEPETRAKVLGKVAVEEIGKRQASRIAQTIARTKSPERREQLLATPYSPLIHDPDMAEASERAAVNWEPTKTEQWRQAPEAKMVAMMVDKWTEALKAADEAIELGKLSPEAMRFAGRKLIAYGEKCIAKGKEWADG